VVALLFLPTTSARSRRRLAWLPGRPRHWSRRQLRLPPSHFPGCARANGQSRGQGAGVRLGPIESSRFRWGDCRPAWKAGASCPSKGGAFELINDGESGGWSAQRRPPSGLWAKNGERPGKSGAPRTRCRAAGWSNRGHVRQLDHVTEAGDVAGVTPSQILTFSDQSP
jgi:hypothetical protein